MANKQYRAAITVAQTAGNAFNSINNVKKWWSENVTGDTASPGGVFTIDWGGGNFVTFRITELAPGKKVVWLVTGCHLDWLNNKQEWTNTQIEFNLSAAGNHTTIDFTHTGLVPELECYDMCVKGWNQYFKGSLCQLIATGEGQPQLKK